MWRNSNAVLRGNEGDMPVALLDMPRELCAPFDVGNLGSFVGQSSTVQTVFVQSDEDLIRKLVLVLDNQLLGVLESRSVQEFAETRASVWQKYVRARRALSDTMSNLVSETEMESIAKACLSTLTADLQKERGVRFGDALTDQSIFMLWTLGKINVLAKIVNEAGEPRDKDADLKLHADYQLYSLWAQFHLDAVAAAMKFKKTMQDDIQGVLCDGLRASVNAFAVLKEALDLRVSKTDPAVAAALPWDEEDERLLASSMRDMNGNLSDDCR